MVYAEPFTNVLDTSTDETQFKGWTRARNLDLIESHNPEWRDRAEGWLSPTLRIELGWARRNESTRFFVPQNDT